MAQLYSHATVLSKHKQLATPEQFSQISDIAAAWMRQFVLENKPRSHSGHFKLCSNYIFLTVLITHTTTIFKWLVKPWTLWKSPMPCIVLAILFHSSVGLTLAKHDYFDVLRTFLLAEWLKRLVSIASQQERIFDTMLLKLTLSKSRIYSCFYIFITTLSTTFWTF